MAIVLIVEGIKISGGRDGGPPVSAKLAITLWFKLEPEELCAVRKRAQVEVNVVGHRRGPVMYRRRMPD